MFVTELGLVQVNWLEANAFTFSVCESNLIKELLVI